MFLGHCNVAARVLPCICSGALTVFNALLCCCWGVLCVFGHALLLLEHCYVPISVLCAFKALLSKTLYIGTLYSFYLCMGESAMSNME